LAYKDVFGEPVRYYIGHSWTQRLKIWFQNAQHARYINLHNVVKN
jgi:hypothetical protein